MASILDSDLSLGIGQLFQQKRVRVPYYQRSYTWKKSQVKELYDDLRRAIDETRDYYFLGSVVGCQVSNKLDEVEIVDGQQRLATTAILLAAIRDQLLVLGDNTQAGKFEERYLFHEEGLRNPVSRPNISLNETDDGYFQEYVLASGAEPPKRRESRVPSHRLIYDAIRAAASLVKEIVGTRNPADQKGQLEKWVKFVEDKARIIFIVVDDPADAFMIFETLNDRGLDLTVADLTKNYLFMKAGEDNVDAAKSCWGKMSATLAASSDSEITKIYIHHLWSSYNGVTRDKELFRDLRNKYDDSTKAMKFTRLLAEKSTVYAALGNSDSDYWNSYGRNAKRHLAILNSSLKVTQVRMLLMAVLDKFKPKDVELILMCCVWWSVRFLIAGGSPSKWESHYARRAKSIRSGEIKSASQLIDDMESDVPNNETFKAQFASEFGTSKSVSRYFLNCFDLTFDADEAFPHLAMDDPKVSDREHVMPQNPDPDHWADLTKEDHEQLCDRMGNYALLSPSDNKTRQNTGFQEAQKIYGKSPFPMTQELSKHTGEWNEDAIQQRQNRMADLAVEIWRVRPKNEKKPRKKSRSK